MTKLETPSVLAFESKLVCSDAIMFAGRWEQTEASGWKPVAIREKAVRGTISNRLKGAKASKIEPKIESANPQTVDTAALNFDTDTLKVLFTLRVLGNLDIPSTCNNPDYQKSLSEKIHSYVDSFGFHELAIRYATNIANARFLWRNRFGAKAVKVIVSDGNKTWRFNAFEYSLENFEKRDDQLLDFASVIENGLKGEAVFLTIEAFVQLGAGQTVFPSQELILDSSDSKKSKVLYQVVNQAAIHSQKLGNALRTIDTAYLPESTEPSSPIAIEPYGSVTNRGIAYRQPKLKNDFYSLLDAWMLKDQDLTEDQLHYVIAMLIRGGVFGAA